MLPLHRSDLFFVAKNTLACWVESVPQEWKVFSQMLWVLTSTPRRRVTIATAFNWPKNCPQPWTPHWGPLLLSGLDHIQLLVSARFLGTSSPPPAGKNTQGQVSLSILLQLPLLSSTFVLLPAQSCFIPYCKQISLFYPGNMMDYSSKSGNS